MAGKVLLSPEELRHAGLTDSAALIGEADSITDAQRRAAVLLQDRTAARVITHLESVSNS
jgi:hypothetical protein